MPSQHHVRRFSTPIVVHVMHTQVNVGGVSDMDSKVNAAYSVMDTIVEENEAYGVAIDGIGIEVMKGNIAYGEVTFQGDSTGDGVELLDQDSSMNDMQ